MDIKWVCLHGYKRFVDRTRIRLDGPLVAIVGPNEAGKTSFLNSLRHLGDSSAFAAEELSRQLRIPVDQVVFEAGMLLDSSGREALEAAGVTSPISWMILRKTAGGIRSIKLRSQPRRETGGRKTAFKLLKKFLRSPIYRRMTAEIEEDKDLPDIKKLATDFNAQSENLPKEVLAATEELVDELRKAVTSASPKYIQILLDSLCHLLKYEGSAHPIQLAIAKLTTRLPSILLFGPEERDLRSEYNLDEVADSPGEALENLCLLAKLDLPMLLSAATRNDQGELETLKSRANKQLASEFERIWSQSRVSVRFHVAGRRLHLQIRDQEDRFSSIDERSDGLRQFIALLAFAAVHYSNRPILLIDELENHLHYDAQADVVQMLARQEVASKVIYTTHSVGALPEDLGTGVRLVVPSVEAAKSHFENWFWTGRTPGFAPLLFGLGARTLAYLTLVQDSVWLLRQLKLYLTPA